MSNKVLQSVGTKVLGTAAKGAITGALGGGGLAGAGTGALSALGGLGGGAVGAAAGGIGSAMTGALTAMGPIGWAALAAGALYSVVGQDKSRLDKIKEAYKKGMKTGDMSIFEKRMDKYPKAAQRFLAKHPEMAAARAAAPGAPGAGGPATGNPMSMGFFQQMLPHMSPAMFARPEAQAMMSMFAPKAPPAGAPPPAPAPGAGQPAMQLFGATSGATGTRGPMPNAFAALNRFSGPTGNGGGRIVPEFAPQLVAPPKQYR